MDNNNEMYQYYSDKEQKAKQQQELALLQNANSQLEENKEFFIIGDKEIEVMNQATEIVNVMNDFDSWCTTNFETHAPQCYYVYEDFLIKNGGIISEIEKVKKE
jgi:hypothetical protein